MRHIRREKEIRIEKLKSLDQRKQVFYNTDIDVRTKITLHHLFKNSAGG